MGNGRPREKFPSGENNPQAKYTDREIELARQLLDAGTPQREVAERMEMSKSQVSKIARFMQR